MTYGSKYNIFIIKIYYFRVKYEKSKKSLILSLILLFIPMIVIGCSSKPKVSADETTKMLFDFYIKGNKESLSKIKISKEQIEEVSKMQKDKTIAKIKTNFTSEGLKISDEQANQIYAARVAALKKLSGKTEVISQDDKSAQVKLKVTYFDEVALDKKQELILWKKLEK